MKKNLFILVTLLSLSILISCSKDDNLSNERDILTGTSWTAYPHDNLSRTWAFGTYGECHYLWQKKGDTPIIKYYNYKIIDEVRVEISNNNGLNYVGIFDDEKLSLTHTGTNETDVYFKDNQILK